MLGGSVAAALAPRAAHLEHVDEVGADLELEHDVERARP